MNCLTLTDTYSHIELDAEARREQTNPARLTPAVENAINVTTNSLNAMATTVISSRAALVCSTERKRRRSKKFRSALQNQHVAIR